MLIHLRTRSGKESRYFYIALPRYLSRSSSNSVHRLKKIRFKIFFKLQQLVVIHDTYLLSVTVDYESNILMFAPIMEKYSN